MSLGLIKICIDPCCEAIWHDCPERETRCKDCDGRIMVINEDTFWKKYAKNWFQYDFVSGAYFRPEKPARQITFDFYLEA